MQCEAAALDDGHGEHQQRLHGLGRLDRGADRAEEEPVRGELLPPLGARHDAELHARRPGRRTPGPGAHLAPALEGVGDDLEGGVARREAHALPAEPPHEGRECRVLKPRGRHAAGGQHRPRLGGGVCHGEEVLELQERVRYSVPRRGVRAFTQQAQVLQSIAPTKAHRRSRHMFQLNVLDLVDNPAKVPPQPRDRGAALGGARAEGLGQGDLGAREDDHAVRSPVVEPLLGELEEPLQTVCSGPHRPRVGRRHRVVPPRPPLDPVAGDAQGLVLAAFAGGLKGRLGDHLPVEVAHQDRVPRLARQDGRVGHADKGDTVGPLLFLLRP
mmetsp:Transcript_58680/g.181952  ORF Transcript_58680/g.181952 Transcript_58680/m.181952 type:complete len:328 (-) Transcript_58680:351-1334(-)